MRESGHRLAEAMEAAGRTVVPGKSTYEIEEAVSRRIEELGGLPAFKGQGEPDNPFPAATCISINNEIVHGIPRRDRIIREGDLVKVDMGIEYRGMITDMARTFAAGRISETAQRLMDVTRNALDEGIRKIRPGVRLMEYSAAVGSYVKAHRFSVVRDLVGHGVGHELHEDPQILNYWARHMENPVLKEGMTLALEPMVNEGTYAIKIMPDGWAFATRDGKLSAHFEDTVAVVEGGCEILTRK